MKFNKNKEECCGCGLCEYVCPVNAIKMTCDDLGFYEPQVDIFNCIECGKCYKYCPINYAHNNKNEHIISNVFAGFNKNREYIRKSSSGGIAATLARHFVSNDGIVFGVQYKKDFSGAEFVKVENESEIHTILKSKYVETDRHILFSEIENAIKASKSVLVFGLACDIVALRALVGYPENLFVCRIVCMANSSNGAFNEFISDYEQSETSKITAVDLRYKSKECHSFPTYVKITYQNGKEYVGPWKEQDLYKAMFIMNRESCNNCIYKDSADSDLIIGDFHGISKEKTYYNEDGTSLIISCSRRGEELLENLNELVLYKEDIEKAVKYNWMIYNKYPKSIFREEFVKDYKYRGLKYACNHLIEKQNDRLEKFSEYIINYKKKVIIWGCGDTLDDLYAKIKVDDWNIVGIVDGSDLKIGNKYKDYIIQPIDRISEMKENADVVAVFIAAEDSNKLDLILQEKGWNKEILHIGKYKYYR